MSDHCNNHYRYKVGCRPCYDARIEVAKAHSLHRTCSVACPVCQQAARWGYREEQDNELNTVYAYLECPKCGLRSREVISLKPEREALEKEWPLNSELSSGGTADKRQQTEQDARRLLK